MLGLDPLSRALLRFVSAAFVLTLIALVYQDHLVRAILPLFDVWLDRIDGTFRTINLSVVTEHGESVIQRLSRPAFAHVVGNSVVFPSQVVEFSNHAAAGIVLQPAILAFSLIIAWPWKKTLELAVRLTMGFLLVPLVLVLDVPMMLYGFAWYEEVKVLDPDRFSLLISWADAMNAGGRYALTVVAVIICVSVGLGISKRSTRSRPASTVEVAATGHELSGGAASVYSVQIER